MLKEDQPRFERSGVCVRYEERRCIEWQMEWVAQMNNIRQRVTEIVLKELNIS